VEPSGIERVLSLSYLATSRGVARLVGASSRSLSGADARAHRRSPSGWSSTGRLRSTSTAGSKREPFGCPGPRPGRGGMPRRSRIGPDMGLSEQGISEPHPTPANNARGGRARPESARPEAGLQARGPGPSGVIRAGRVAWCADQLKLPLSVGGKLQGAPSRIRVDGSARGYACARAGDRRRRRCACTRSPSRAAGRRAL